MKRDDDLIRNLLLEAESHEETSILRSIEMDGSYLDRLRMHNVDLMCDAGLFAEVGEYSVRLTKDGHDYLDAIRDETIWKKPKKA